MNVSLTTSNFTVRKSDGTELTAAEWELARGGIAQKMANAVVASLQGVEGVQVTAAGMDVTFGFEQTTVVEETYIGQ